MLFILLRFTALAFVYLGIPMAAATSKTAEWTIMVYMNAKNNLEPDALTNFEELSKIGSSSAINVLVEFGRPNQQGLQRGTVWSGVLRFRVLKSQLPTIEAAVQDLRENSKLSDLGTIDALEDFVDWSISRYPAKHYMLVIWNHGQGWRFQAAEDRSVRALSARSLNTLVSARADTQEVLKKTPSVGGYRAVSFDQTTGHFLYNSDVEAVTRRASAKIGKKLDIVGFDACLMSMLETAYAFRDSAEIIVASEELEPEAGWDYRPIVRALSNDPNINARTLSKVIVNSYKLRNGDYRETTMSALDLALITNAANSISILSDAFIAKMASERNNIQSARSKVAAYGTDDLSIDLITLLAKIKTISSDAELIKKIDSAEAAVRKTVIFNYASSSNSSEKGSLGIAIYFPSDLNTFKLDPYHLGYLKENTDHSIDFVTQERWANFLAVYLR